MVSVRIWTNGTRIISARLRQLPSTERLVAQLSAGDGPTSIPELLVDWIENIIDDMAETMAKLEEHLTKAESLHRYGRAGTHSPDDCLYQEASIDASPLHGTSARGADAIEHGNADVAG